jgi:hypothetical protein
MEPGHVVDDDDCPLLWALEDVLGRLDIMHDTNPEFKRIVFEGKVSIWEDDISDDLTKCPCSEFS